MQSLFALADGDKSRVIKVTRADESQISGVDLSSNSPIRTRRDRVKAFFRSWSQAEKARAALRDVERSRSAKREKLARELADYDRQTENLRRLSLSMYSISDPDSILRAD